MSEQRGSDQAEHARDAGEDEVLDALPVLVQRPTVVPVTSLPTAVSRSSSAVIPAVQAAAVAAGGFVAGAAVVGLVQRRQARTAKVGKRRRRARGVGRAAPAGRTGRGGRAPRAAPTGAELVQIVSSRSLLVDVHLLGPAGGER